MTSISNSAASVAARHGYWRAWTRDRVLALLLISPSLIAFAVFVYGFIAWTGWVSLLNWDNVAHLNGIFPDVPFAGWDTYARLLQNDRFQIDLRNTLAFTLLFLMACLTVGFLLAAMLEQPLKGAIVYRTIILLPTAISFIVTGVVWRWMLVPRAGVNLILNATVNPAMKALGLPAIVPGWYTDPTVWSIPPDGLLGAALIRLGWGGLASEKVGIPVAILSVVIAATWQMSGYVMALYWAGLRTIPPDLRDAARVDGATEWQIYRHVVWPLLTPITLAAIVVLTNVSLRTFDLVYALSGQGPAFATDMPALFMFVTTFQGNFFSQGAAVSTLLLLASAVVVVPFLIYRRRSGVE